MHDFQKSRISPRYVGSLPTARLRFHPHANKYRDRSAGRLTRGPRYVGDGAATGWLGGPGARPQPAAIVVFEQLHALPEPCSAQGPTHRAPVKELPAHTVGPCRVM